MDCYAHQPPGPCANCGKYSGAVMVSSEWGHGQMCCSDACGRRLAAKIANGMLPTDNWEDERALDMRIRIKQLAAKVKALAAAAPTQEKGNG